MRLIVAVLALALALILPTGLADQCAPTGPLPEVDTGSVGGSGVGAPEDVAGRYYVDHDPCHEFCGFSVWVYQESNGIDGLQRDDEVRDDTCGGTIAGDTLIF